MFKRDTGIRVPWPRAVQTIEGVRYAARDALLYKARLDRPKDRADWPRGLDADARAWLADTWTARYRLGEMVGGGEGKGGQRSSKASLTLMPGKGTLT